MNHRFESTISWIRVINTDVDGHQQQRQETYHPTISATISGLDPGLAAELIMMMEQALNRSGEMRFHISMMPPVSVEEIEADLAKMQESIKLAKLGK